MNNLNDTYNQPDKYTAFWNRMAEHYPDPLDEKTLSETNEAISIIKGRGVEIDRASILDIGCGTGTYTLPLSRDAEAVTGLDDSDVMIERLTSSISLSGIRNVYPVKASWKDIDIKASAFEKAFDIVWASMTPAIKARQDFNKMERCSKKWCVYIGWGGKRENRLMEEIFELHGLKYGPPQGVEGAYDIVTQAGRTPSLDYFEAEWDWTGSVDEAIEDVECFLEMQGGKPDHSIIEAVVGRYEQDGMISHSTSVKEGIMVWKV